MCGRYHNHLQKMHDWVDVLNDWPSDSERLGYNVSPTQQAPIVTKEATVFARWGLIPSWSKEFNSKYATHNARIETASSKPAFRSSWKHARTCLVPAQGYYEWKLEEGAKQPYNAHKPDDILVFAGLWEAWEDQISFTIITEEANGELANLHSRMPIMLNQPQALRWLDETHDVQSDQYKTIEYYPVNKKVNNSRGQGEDLIARI